ncbi:uncharacterized protein B0H18DRAFT_383695 [Fomitopsis serialis]|uniref:uncharacterized protein n=1 Tax=Fomitopsis serialis TaxID=139415 RepID=UPI002007F9AF|nr:uncharacterized protein B0H18DRAFT_383695 [Neoantrodia serialis]KAH9925310.1 hypothetical protein B0H18DRAFT_383695 [Neoantrodia serialis]
MACLNLSNVQSVSRTQTSLAAKQRLPLEVQERVLDFVAGSMDSRETMKACITTCKAWTPRCRFHLLYEVHLRSRQEVFSFARLLDSNPHFRNEVVYAHIGSREGTPQPIEYVESFAARFAGKLPAVHHLMIRNAEMKPTNLRLDSHLHFSSFVSLRELSLMGILFRTPTMFLRTVCCFPGVTLLQCTDVDIQEEHRPGLHPVTVPSIRHLGVDGSSPSIEKVIHTFVSGSLSVALRTIVLGYRTAVPLQELTGVVQRLLDAAGPSLRTFSSVVDETKLKLDERIEQYINFTPNTRLERIIIRIPVKDQPILSWISHVLSSITFDSDGEVCLIFNVDAGDNTPLVLQSLLIRLQDSVCSEIEAVMFLPGFTKLKRLSVELYIVPWNIALSQTAWSETIMTAMPRLHARGILYPCMRVFNTYSMTDQRSLLRSGVSIIPGSSAAETLGRISRLNDGHTES